MRTQNDIDLLYRPKSLEEIKAEIQNSRKSGLNLQREENTATTGMTQPKRKESKESNTPEQLPVLIFIIAAVFLAMVA